MGAHSPSVRRMALNIATTWPASLLLKLRWQTVGQTRLIAREFSALVDFLRECGCTFHSCSELGAKPVPRGISFRYDVHSRDLPGAFVFAELHRQQGIPASFFLFWDYSRLEHVYCRDYLKLNAMLSPPLEAGLHDSPVDAYLLRSMFQGDSTNYEAWLRSPESLDWFLRLAEDRSELEALNGSVFEMFQGRVQRARKLFGPMRTIAAHGGAIGQQWRPQLPTLGPAAEIVRGLFARNWLTPERLSAVGLDAAVNAYGEFVQGWIQCSCAGGRILSMAKCMRRALLQRDSAVQILLHPYTWTGARRDSDLREALFVTAA
jgi:hypothetical protein